MVSGKFISITRNQYKCPHTSMALCGIFIKEKRPFLGRSIVERTKPKGLPVARRAPSLKGLCSVSADDGFWIYNFSSDPAATAVHEDALAKKR